MIDPICQMMAKEPFKSERLRRLISFKGTGEDENDPTGLLPYLDDAISEFEMLIVWKKVAGCEDQIPEPQRGLDQHFDATNDKVNGVKKELETYLEKAKQIILKHNDNKNQNLLNQ